jgi:hypothetical protein
MELQLTEESIKNYLDKNYNECSIISDIDEAKFDFIDADWEDEFEDEHDAYIETGRGEAEAQVRMQIEKEILEKLEIKYFDLEEKLGKTISDIITEVFPCLDA